MGIDRFRPAHGVDDLALPRRIGQVIVTANDVRDAHVLVIHDDREHVRRRAVRTQQDEVVKHVIAKADIALDLVTDDGLTRLWRLDAHDRRNIRPAIRRRRVTPASVITDRQVRGALLLAHFLEFFGCRVAVIGLARREQLPGNLGMTFGARELVDDLVVPGESEPAHAVEDRLDGLVG